MYKFINEFGLRIPYALAMGIGGAVGFVWVQVLNQPSDVAIWLGTEVVNLGGYPEHFVSPIGWTTHLAVSVSYSLVCALVASLPFFPRDVLGGSATALGVGLLLGWGTTVLAYPALSMTISLLAGQGFPTAPLASINWGQDVIPLINHLWFFIVGLFVTGVIPGLSSQTHTESAAKQQTG